MKDIIVRNAEEFGVHIKAGGWRLGFLVAQSVAEIGHGGDRRSTAARHLNGKVSATEFTKAAKLNKSGDPKRVLRFLEAWNRAAEDGIVAPADTLTPGEELDLDVDKLGPWEDYYPPMRAIERIPEDRRKAIEKAATEAGTTPDQVNKVTSSRPALIAAIKADPKTRQAVIDAIGDDAASTAQVMERASERRPAPPKPEREPLATDLIAALGVGAAINQKAKTLSYNIDTIVAWLREDGRSTDDQTARAIREDIDGLRAARDRCEMYAEQLEVALDGGVSDERLAEFMEGR